MIPPRVNEVRELQKYPSFASEYLKRAESFLNDVRDRETSISLMTIPLLKEYLFLEKRFTTLTTYMQALAGRIQPLTGIHAKVVAVISPFFKRVAQGNQNKIQVLKELDNSSIGAVLQMLFSAPSGFLNTLLQVPGLAYLRLTYLRYCGTLTGNIDLQKFRETLESFNEGPCEVLFAMLRYMRKSDTPPQPFVFVNPDLLSSDKSFDPDIGVLSLNNFKNEHGEVYSTNIYYTTPRYIFIAIKHDKDNISVKIPQKIPFTLQLPPNIVRDSSSGLFSLKSSVVFDPRQGYIAYIRKNMLDKELWIRCDNIIREVPFKEIVQALSCTEYDSIHYYECK